MAKTVPSAGDGLNDGIWQSLCGFVVAASRGDVIAAQKAIPRMESELPNDGQAGMYVRYLLEYRVIELLGRRPLPKDLHELAISAWPRFAGVVRADRGDENLLEDILRTVFEFAPEARKIIGGKMIVLGAAALGALLYDPVTELEAIKPHLARWWSRNVEDFRARGIIGARAERH